MATESEEKKRTRSKNFSFDEKEVLTREVKGNFPVIMARHCNGTSGVTKKVQDKVWESITEKVNAVGVARRTVQEVREKWRNLTKKAKTEVSMSKKHAAATGGGPPAPLPDRLMEEVSSLFNTSHAFHGIPGALDCESSLFPSDIDTSNFPSTVDLESVQDLEQIEPVIEYKQPPQQESVEHSEEKIADVDTSSNRKKHRNLTEVQREFLIESTKNQQIKRKLIEEEREFLRESTKSVKLFSEAISLFIKKMNES